MRFDSWAKAACRSFCALLNSSLASSTLTLAKLTSRSERILLVASALDLVQEHLPRGHGLLGHAGDRLGLLRGEKAPSTASRICCARGLRAVGCGFGLSLALPVKLAVRPKSVMSWLSIKPSALRSKMAGLFSAPMAASRVLLSAVPTATTLAERLGKNPDRTCAGDLPGRQGLQIGDADQRDDCAAPFHGLPAE